MTLAHRTIGITAPPDSSAQSEPQTVKKHAYTGTYHPFPPDPILESKMRSDRVFVNWNSGGGSIKYDTGSLLIFIAGLVWYLLLAYVFVCFLFSLFFFFLPRFASPIRRASHTPGSYAQESRV